MAGPPIPGDDPVVEREPERRQALVVGGDRRQPLEDVAEVVAEEADEPAEERRRIGRDDGRRVEPGDEPAGDGERVRPGGGRLEDGDGIGGQVVQRALRPGRALSSRASPGRSRNASAASIGAGAAIRSGSRRSRSGGRGRCGHGRATWDHAGMTGRGRRYRPVSGLRDPVALSGHAAR